MTTYRISDAARRTGLPTSTLRYYERIGLVSEPERSESGYRVYEERALDRLDFIAHARALGLRLDEIGELADLWDADRCGSVQVRLRALIEAKVADTQAQATALAALSSELSSFVRGLSSPAPNEPCGETCGCHRHAPAPADVPALNVLAQDGLDLACSLGTDESAGRLAEWQALSSQAIDRTPIEGGVRLEFGPGQDLRQLADLVAREQACCTFLSFSIALTPSATTLEATGPADSGSMIDGLLGAGA